MSLDKDKYLIDTILSILVGSRSGPEAFDGFRLFSDLFFICVFFFFFFFFFFHQFWLQQYIFVEMICTVCLNLNLNGLLVTRQIDNTSPGGWGGGGCARREISLWGNWSFRPITISAHDNIGP